MGNNLEYVEKGDNIKASQWNKIVDYVNGPGEYTTNQYMTTSKGVLYSQVDGYYNGEMGKITPLLEGSIINEYDEDLSVYVPRYCLQLGSSFGSTKNSFTYKNEPVKNILVFNNDHPERDFEILSDYWVLPNQGVVNLSIDVLSNYYDGIKGSFCRSILSTDDPEITGFDEEVDGEDKRIAYDFNYYLVFNNLSSDEDLTERLSTYIEENNLLSTINVSSDSWEQYDLDVVKDFEILKFIPLISSDDFPEDAVSCYQSKLIQMHLGAYHYQREDLKLPWQVNAVDGTIERTFVQIGTKIFSSGIVSTDIEGNNYLRVNVDTLSCQLCSQPYEDAKTVSFRMFNYLSGDSVEYYNIMPIIPCWERYNV